MSEKQQSSIYCRTTKNSRPIGGNETRAGEGASLFFDLPLSSISADI